MCHTNSNPPHTIIYTLGQNWDIFRKQTLRRSWNHEFQSSRSLSHVIMCCSMGLLLFSTQKLNNEYDYSSKEPDKTIRNKVTFRHISWTGDRYLHKIKKMYLKKNEFLVSEEPGRIIYIRIFCLLQQNNSAEFEYLKLGWWKVPVYEG